MKSIKDYVDALPEVYQNIYGHKEFDKDSSRNCEERKECICEVIKAFQKKLGKTQLRVLDLGCAQGYYSFSAAELGCVVDGIDFCKENIDLCKALQEENGLTCSYKHDKITKELIESIADKNYDIIMFYSVVHHIANENGFEYAREVFETLADKSGIVLTELALKEEPLYWNKNLPEKYDEWFDNVSFYDEQRFFETHLSEYARPLILYSNDYCYLKGEFYSINNYKNSSYSGKKNDNNKRYYFCEDNTVFIKRFGSRVSDVFKNELLNEIKTIESNNITFAPKLLGYDTEYSRVLEVVSIEYGTILRNLMLDGHDLDFEKIIADVLDNCCELERKGLYHSDVRSWNVCINKSGKAYLIDIGAVSSEPFDIVLQDQYRTDIKISVLDSFLSFVYDCVRGETYKTIDTMEKYNMTMYFDFETIPEKFSNFIKKCLTISVADRSFKKFNEIYKDVVLEGNSVQFSTEDELRILQHQQARMNVQKTNEMYVFENVHRLESNFNEQYLSIIQNENQKLLELNESLQNAYADLNNKYAQLQGEVNLINDWVLLRAYRAIMKLFGR